MRGSYAWLGAADGITLKIPGDIDTGFWDQQRRRLRC
jgi:hypothetical protein